MNSQLLNYLKEVSGALKAPDLDNLLEQTLDGKKRLSQARYDQRLSGIKRKLQSAQQRGDAEGSRKLQTQLDNFMKNYRPPLKQAPSKPQPKVKKAKGSQKDKAPSKKSKAKAEAPEEELPPAPMTPNAVPAIPGSAPLTVIPEKELKKHAAEAKKAAEKAQKEAEKAKKKAEKEAEAAKNKADKEKAKLDKKAAKESAVEAAKAAKEAAKQAEFEQAKADLLKHLEKGPMSSQDLALKLHKVPGKTFKLALMDLMDNGLIEKGKKGWAKVEQPTPEPEKAPDNDVPTKTDGKYLVGPAYGMSDTMPRPQSEVDATIQSLTALGVGPERIAQYQDSVEPVPDEEWNQYDYRIRVHPEDWDDNTHGDKYHVRDPKAPKASATASQMAANAVAAVQTPPAPVPASNPAAPPIRAPRGIHALVQQAMNRPSPIQNMMAKSPTVRTLKPIVNKIMGSKAMQALKASGKAAWATTKFIGKMVYDAQVQKIRQARWDRMMRNIGRQASLFSGILEPLIGPQNAAKYSSDWALKLNKGSIDRFDKLGYTQAGQSQRAGLVNPAREQYLAYVEEQRRKKNKKKRRR